MGVYTIVEVKSGKGSTAGWGRLKSGAGWISLDYTIPSAYNEEHLSLSEPVGIPAWGVFTGSFLCKGVEMFIIFLV